MKIIRFLLKNYVFSVLLMAGIFLFGLAALFTLKIELLPAIDIPRLTVVTAYSSGSAAETENLITLNVEEALSAVNGVNSVRSVSLSEMSITELSFNYGYSLNRAVIDIRKKLDFIKNKLPREAERPVIIRAPDAAGTILTIAAVNTGLPERFFAQEIRKNIKGALKRTAGVSSVTIKGLRQRQIHIKTKPEKLKAHNLTITELSRLISSHNASYPAGMIKLKNTEIPVKINAAITNIHILRNLPLQSGNNGAVVQLKDIAAVTYGKERPADFASLNSKPVVLLKTCKRFRANTLDVCRHAFTTINNLKQKYENKIRFTITYNQADYISRSLKQLIAALLIGILLGFAVLYLFFRDLATALLITAVIPLSFFIIFLLMYIFNITINLITLGGMALGAGMVIDASILAVYALSGIDFSRKNIIDAMLHKLKVIFPSIFTSVLSTIAVFIPVIFLKGLISEVFRDMALVIIFSLSASLIISMSFIPLLFYLFNTRFAFFKKKISFTAHNRAALFWSDQAGKIKKNISIGDALLLLTRMEEIPFNPKLHKVRRVTKDDYKHFVKESIAYDNEDIREKIYNLPPYSVVHADEGLRFLMASDWNKSENKELKKIVGQCRTKHLIFLICIPSFSWVDKKYRNDMCNYWIRLVMRGTAIISVPNLGEVVDPWDMKLFSKYLGSYTHISTIEEIEKRIKKLLKHPNVRDRINIPKVSKALYKYYLEFRDMRALSKKNNEEKYVDKKDELAILLYTLMHYDPGPNVKRTFSYKDLKHYLKHPVKGDIMFTSRQIINKCRGIRKEIKNFNELAKQKLSLKKKMEKMEKELYQPKNKEKNNIDPLTGMKLN